MKCKDRIFIGVDKKGSSITFQLQQNWNVYHQYEVELSDGAASRFIFEPLKRGLPAAELITRRRTYDSKTGNLIEDVDIGSMTPAEKEQRLFKPLPE